ncbi:MAG: ACP S-malonyltransferase [Planctomycetota bacterium]
MVKAALLFPGQGSQKLGMGLDLDAAEPAYRKVLDLAEQTLDLPLREILRGTEAERLNRTDVCQPAILATSLATLAALEAHDRLDLTQITAVAGLSLGEYTALTFAGALPVEDALRLVQLRGQAMQRASEERPSGMLSLVGATAEVAQALCNQAVGDGVLVVANHLAPGQVAIAGTRDALDRAQGLLKDHGIRKAVPLAVAGAFHSPCMESAAADLGRALDAAPFRAPRWPVVLNVTGQPATDPAAIRAALKRQVTSPVLWSASLDWLLAQGCRHYFEPAPGRQLTNLLGRRKDVEVHVAGCDSKAELDALPRWPGVAA